MKKKLISFILLGICSFSLLVSCDNDNKYKVNRDTEDNTCDNRFVATDDKYWVGDIDSYTVDPFINIISKAGLVVFVAFTIGIMWTVITIEIVDSKKEIGILRSIGLSGIKVSIILPKTLF